VGSSGTGYPQPPPARGNHRALRASHAAAATQAQAEAEAAALLKADPVSAADLLAALDSTKPSSDGNMARYLEWQRDFGAV
jgi:hypothetical protein